MAIGRLGREKGFDLLIDAFSRVARRYPAWELWVWGEGQERPSLEAQVTSLGLEGRVFLPGSTDTPWEEMQRSEIVVVPSRYEGMPNAMLEAMALGRAVVASDCASGPREVSDDGRCAVLVAPEDVTALVLALDRLMGDAEERQRIGALALSVRERYSLERVLALWEELFMHIETVRRAEPVVR
jgi:glycosyltransferase involved in cell wall biosynthesis